MHPVIGYVAYTGVRIVQVKDYYLPENVTYICNVAALASDADTYPDPEKFDTARFGAPESLDAALRGPWMPFAHSCASEFTRVAGLPLVCAVVAAFVRKYDVSGAEDRQHLQETTCRPFKGLPMTLAAAAK
jgi:cytochrome P450